jgi:hypothetical protein
MTPPGSDGKSDQGSRSGRRREHFSWFVHPARNHKCAISGANRGADADQLLNTIYN